MNEALCREVHKNIHGKNAVVSSWRLRNSGAMSAMPDQPTEYSGVLQDYSVYHITGSSNYPSQFYGTYDEGCFFNYTSSPKYYSLYFKILER